LCSSAAIKNICLYSKLHFYERQPPIYPRRRDRETAPCPYFINLEYAVINQGGSTNLISRKRAPLSRHKGRIGQNLWRGRAIDKKNPAKIGRELINQGASTH